MYRVGGRLDPILEGVRQLQQRKLELGQARPAVELQFIAMRHNEHELPAMRRLAEELATPLRVKTVGLGDVSRQPGRQEWLPYDVSLRRYRECDGGLVLAHDRRPSSVCDHPWHRLVINWDGQVTACCYDPHCGYAFGNAAEGLSTVWNGWRLQAFRQACRSTSPPAICTRCAVRLGARVSIRALDRSVASPRRTGRN